MEENAARGSQNQYGETDREQSGEGRVESRGGGPEAKKHVQDEKADRLLD